MIYERLDKQGWLVYSGINLLDYAACPGFIVKIFLICFCSLILILITAAVGGSNYQSAMAAPLPQVSLPGEGWQVCADLGLGELPGGGGQTQHFEVCQGGGWMVRAYCLDPGMPVPPVGAPCSLMNGDTFWCGDGTQELRLYQVIATPAPTVTPSLIPTQTATATPPIPTVLPIEDTPTLTPTVYYRPVAGGPGNLPGIAALGGIALFLVAAGTGGLFRWYRATSHRR